MLWNIGRADAKSSVSDFADPVNLLQVLPAHMRQVREGSLWQCWWCDQQRQYKEVLLGMVIVTSEQVYFKLHLWCDTSTISVANIENSVRSLA